MGFKEIWKKWKGRISLIAIVCAFLLTYLFSKLEISLIPKNIFIYLLVFIIGLILSLFIIGYLIGLIEELFFSKSIKSRKGGIKN